MLQSKVPYLWKITPVEHVCTVYWIEISSLPAHKEKKKKKVQGATQTATRTEGSAFKFYIVRANCVSACTFVVAHLSSRAQVIFAAFDRHANTVRAFVWTLCAHYSHHVCSHSSVEFIFVFIILLRHKLTNIQIECIHFANSAIKFTVNHSLPSVLHDKWA